MSAVKSQPWMKFYPQDWRADEKLRMCSLAARGLWIEMLAIMHRSERYGQLLIGGRVPTDAQLAVQVGASPSEVTALLAELDGAGVFSRAASGAIYSRRMTRDHKKAENARKNGQNGGNPALTSSGAKTKEKSASDNGSDKGGLKGRDKPQKPEARDQKPDLPPSPPARPKAGPPPDLAAVMEAGRYVQIPPDHPLLADWLAAGADLDSQIVPVVRAEAEKLIGRTNRGPLKLVVFDAAVRQRIADDERETTRRRRSIEHMRRIEEEQERERAEEARLREIYRRTPVALQ